jgi:hypothetical protein
MSAPDRRALLDRDHGKLSIRRQCVLLSLARSGVYRTPRPANDSPREGGDLALMRRIDELFTAWPFLGSRRMVAMLRAARSGARQSCAASWLRHRLPQCDARRVSGEHREGDRLEARTYVRPTD